MNDFFIKKKKKKTVSSDSLISISFLKMLGSSGFGFLRRSLFSAVRYGKQPPMVGLGLGIRHSVAFFCAEPSSSNHPEKRFNVAGGGGEKGVGDESISFAEAKKLMRLVNVEALKRKLGMEEEEVIMYTDLLKACESMGVARSSAEAASFARVLDEAGVILLFRDKVYLHPDKVVDLVRRAVPLALSPEDDPRRGELKKLQQEKQEIDMLAHKQVRRILWSGLAFSVTQVGLFFRLTFWEFSWDVMEPIAFFTTTTGLVIGYAYFLFTSRDPTYQDLMKRLFISRQRKLYKKQKFDFDRFIELQRHCKSPLDTTTSGTIKTKLELDPEDIIHRDQPHAL